jgi:hypothetical protein
VKYKNPFKCPQCVNLRENFDADLCYRCLRRRVKEQKGYSLTKSGYMDIRR